MHFCWDPPTETRVHWEKKGGKCMGEGHKKLNISDCMGLAIGQIIGSGIMVLTGIVIGLTGFGKLDGSYFVEKAEHAVSSSGYRTSAEIRRTLSY